jgi:dTDP-L-rhamnose 4-epimerase
VVTGQYRLGDVRHITADSTQLRSELGWQPEVGFTAGMAELAHLGEEGAAPAALRASSASR